MECREIHFTSLIFALTGCGRHCATLHDVGLSKVPRVFEGASDPVHLSGMYRKLTQRSRRSREFPEFYRFPPIFARRGLWASLRPFCWRPLPRRYFAGLRSGVVFWIEEWSIEFVFTVSIVEKHVLWSALRHIFAGLKRTRDQKLSSGLKSGHFEFVFTVTSSRNMSCGVRCSTSSRVLAQFVLL